MRMTSWWWLAVVLAACGDVSAVPPDAQMQDDAPAAPDASSARCDPSKPFGTPTLVGGVDTAAYGEAGASLSPDELTIYYASNSDYPGTPNFDLYAATRGSITDDFGAPQKLTSLDLAGDERQTWITADQLTLYMYSSGGGNYDVYVATRASVASAFGAPQALGVNTTDIEQDARTTGDGQTLYFTRSTNTTGAIYRAALGPTGFTDATEVTELAPGGSEVPSPDDLAMYFTSDRAGSLGGLDIWVATRASTGSPFGDITHLPEVSSPSFEVPTWISADGCHLYLTSDRGGSFDVWVAARPR